MIIAVIIYLAAFSLLMKTVIMSAMNHKRQRAEAGAKREEAAK